MKKLALLVILFLLAPLVQAAALVNINTADVALLDTLPGIGPTKAAAIVAYRDAHGPFATKEAIQDVSGIGPATYADIEPLITVGTTQSSSAASQSTSAAAVTTNTSNNTQNTAVASSRATLVVSAGADRTLIQGAETTFSTNVVDAGGVAQSGAEVHWTFGDGSSAIGQSVKKSYAASGTYLLEVSGALGGVTATDEATIVVKAVDASITGVTTEGIVLHNNATEALDLSYWQLREGGGVYTLPLGTKIVGKGSVTFPPEVTGLTFSTDVALLYPSGKTAVVYGALAPAAQPLAPVARSISMQERPAVSTSVTQTAHDTQVVSAPAALVTPAAAGAALPGTSSPAKSASRTLISKLTSPWTLGFLGLLVVAGGVIMVL